MSKINGTAAGLIALLSACQLNAPPEKMHSVEGANPPPLPLTARGQEPGWILRLKEGSLTLDYRYGQKQLTADTPAAESTANGWRYQRRSAQQSFSIDISRDYCEDVMSGLPYPFTVTVALEGTTLRGCGGDTKALLTGSPWSVEEVNDRAVGEGLPATIHFTDDYRVYGSAGCNRYTGSYQITGQGISIEDLALTRMACAPPVMKQEGEVVSVLKAASGFRIDEAGALVLQGRQGQHLSAVRSSN